MIAKIKTRVDFGGIVNYANDQKNKKKCATLLAHEGVCAISNKLIADSFCLLLTEVCSENGVDLSWNVPRFQRLKFGLNRQFLC